MELIFFCLGIRLVDEIDLRIEKNQMKRMAEHILGCGAILSTIVNAIDVHQLK